MVVLQASVLGGRLVLWGESRPDSPLARRKGRPSKTAPVAPSPFDPGLERLAEEIGQTKNVQVHKFLCVGTLEEKIDEMIESKKEIANAVVGGGEQWLTKLSTAELKDLFALRREALRD
jgi:hypothetical protein